LLITPYRGSLFPRVAFYALKHRDVAKIHRVFERLVRLMTGVAFSVAECTEVYRMLEGPDFYGGGGVL
jgi:hypothetical protein